jgi:uncharacterized RDD family membrane protein YckC
MICPVCQSRNEAGEQYCARCGGRLEEAREAATVAAPGDVSESPDSLNEQAIRAISRDEVPDALELVDRALAINATHLPALRTRADILRRIGLTNQAAAEEAKIRTLDEGEQEFAGFGARAGAVLLDAVFVFLLSFVPGLIAALIIYAAIVPDNPTDAEERDAMENGVYYGWYVVMGVTGFFYYWIGNALGGTWGKRVLKLRVFSIDSREPIGVGRGFVRYLVSNIGTIAFGLGWLWMLWDKNKQTWHDKAAGSIVVKVRPPGAAPKSLR